MSNEAVVAHIFSSDKTAEDRGEPGANQAFANGKVHAQPTANNGGPKKPDIASISSPGARSSLSSELIVTLAKLGAAWPPISGSRTLTSCSVRCCALPISPAAGPNRAAKSKLAAT